MTKIIAFTDPKGGVGKSAVSLNTAFLLSQSSKVLLLEADKQLSIYDWKRIRDSKQSESSLPFEFEFCDGDLLKFFNEYKTKLSEFDYIIIDTAGRDSIESRTALLLADIALCPVIPATFARNALLRFFKVIETAREHNKKLIPLIFLNNCSPSQFSKLANEVAMDFSQLNNGPLLLTNRLVRQEACYENSLQSGLSIFEYKHRSVQSAREQLATLITEVLTYAK